MALMWDSEETLRLLFQEVGKRKMAFTEMQRTVLIAQEGKIQ